MSKKFLFINFNQDEKLKFFDLDETIVNSENNDTSGKKIKNEFIYLPILNPDKLNNQEIIEIRNIQKVLRIS